MRNGNGTRAYDITTMYIKAFPPAKMPLRVLIDRFDRWALKNDLYRYPDDTVIDPTVNGAVAALSQARQQLREKINEVACSDQWRLAGNVPFHVHVLDVGKAYQMTDPETAFDTKTKLMPGQVKGFTTAKDKAISKLQKAIDMSQLTEEQRLTIGTYTRTRAMFAHLVNTQMELFAQELEEIVKHQQRRKGLPPKP